MPDVSIPDTELDLLDDEIAIQGGGRGMAGTLFLLLLLIAGAAVGGWLYLRAANTYEHKLAMALLDKEFLERDGVLRGIDDVELYRTQRDRLLNWYYLELDEIHQQHGVERDWPEFKAKIQRAFLAGEAHNMTEPICAEVYAALREDQTKFLERYERVEELYQVMRRGEYSFVGSGGDGGQRIDLVEISADDFGGARMLKLDFVLWGASGELQFGDSQMRGYSQADRECAKANASGGPVYVIDRPSCFVPDFPPGTAVGHDSAQRLPPFAHSVDFQIESVVPTGTAARISMRFDINKMPVEDEWIDPTAASWRGKGLDVDPGEMCRERR